MVQLSAVSKFCLFCLLSFHDDDAIACVILPGLTDVVKKRTRSCYCRMPCFSRVTVSCMFFIYTPQITSHPSQRPAPPSNPAATDPPNPTYPGPQLANQRLPRIPPPRPDQPRSPHTATLTRPAASSSISPPNARLQHAHTKNFPRAGEGRVAWAVGVGEWRLATMGRTGPAGDSAENGLLSLASAACTEGRVAMPYLVPPRKRGGAWSDLNSCFRPTPRTPVI